MASSHPDRSLARPRRVAAGAAAVAGVAGLVLGVVPAGQTASAAPPQGSYTGHSTTQANYPVTFTVQGSTIVNFSSYVTSGCAPYQITFGFDSVAINANGSFSASYDADDDPGYDFILELSGQIDDAGNASGVMDLDTNFGCGSDDTPWVATADNPTPTTTTLPPTTTTLPPTTTTLPPTTTTLPPTTTTLPPTTTTLPPTTTTLPPTTTTLPPTTTTLPPTTTTLPPTTTTLPPTTTTLPPTTTTLAPPTTTLPPATTTTIVASTVVPSSTSTPPSPTVTTSPPTSPSAPSTPAPTPAPPAGPSTPPAGPVVAVDDPSATFGQQVTVTARGFVPGEEVVATLHSTPRPLGSYTADAAGVVSFGFVPRADDGAGLHRVVLVGETSGTAEATVRFVAADDLPATGAATRGVLLLASGALLAGGLVVLAMQRRQSDAG